MSSLVAYGSSDENDSDADDTETSQTTSIRLIETPSNNQKSEENPPKEASLFRSLPAPRSREIIEEENDTFLEASEVPTTKPALKSSKNEKVKISVPALSTFDSDEEEEEPSKKRPKFEMQGKCGLFSMLPPPKSNAAGKVANRPLIPHTLTKKVPPKPKEPPKPKPDQAVVVQPHASTASDDSDDEIEKTDAPLKFFSIGEHKEQAVQSLEDPVAVATTNENACVSNSTEPVSDNVSYDPSAYEDDDDDVDDDEDMEAPVMGPARPDASEMNDQPLELNDEVLLKLQGKRKLKQEEINIIDISQADQLPQTKEWLMKSLTEEKASHSPKCRAPTSQQRRKHQITYLAFQAKERELELKNQWAQNRLTRRQTQSKYGF